VKRSGGDAGIKATTLVTLAPDSKQQAEAVVPGRRVSTTWFWLAVARLALFDFDSRRGEKTMPAISYSFARALGPIAFGRLVKM